MAIVSKLEAITLLARRYDSVREEGESDLTLVKRIRDQLRSQQENVYKRRLQQIDDRLMQEALDEFYIDNPTEKDSVESFD